MLESYGFSEKHVKVRSGVIDVFEKKRERLRLFLETKPHLRDLTVTPTRCEKAGLLAPRAPLGTVALFFIRHRVGY